MLLIGFLITFLYTALIILFLIGFDLVQPFKLNKNDSKNAFSILIPFRNEAADLPILLDSIKQLSYPKEMFEIIFINDESDDESLAIIEEFFFKKQHNVRIIDNNRATASPKKDAINSAIHKAKFDWILTTDADCLLPKKWLQAFDAFIEKTQPKLVVAPVTYNSNNTFSEQFQLLDFLSLQGCTVGSFGIKKPFLCNGANLCYLKNTFFEVNGFDGNSDIASGDDIFLLEKIAVKYPDKVHYLKSNEALVITKPQPAFKQLLEQRVRWAAKSTAYKNSFSKFIGVTVLSMNLFLAMLLITSVLAITQWQFGILIFIIKFSIDLFLLLKITFFFKQQKTIAYYLFSSLLYPFFIILVVILSLKSGYSWKGRQFKK